MQLFNKEQREGFAKIADNLVTASIVATIVGGFVDKKIGAFEVTILILIAVTFLVMSYVFRGSEDNGN